MLTAQVLEGLVHKAITKAQKTGALPRFEVPQVTVQPPRQAEFGDLSSSVCMQMARLARMAPIKIAGIVVDHIVPNEMIGEINIVPPGFLNFTLSSSWLAQQVEKVLQAGDRYGDIDIGQGRKLQVEFVSANPTGPLHVGSARNAAIGDALANVLAAAGYDVQREYYVNDAGSQMGLFAETLYARYAQALGRDEPLPEGGYQVVEIAIAECEPEAADAQAPDQLAPDL